MYNKVIVASDLSDASMQVVECIKDLKQFGTQKILLFHALGLRHLEDLRFELMRYAEPLLNKQKQILEGFGYEVTISIGSDGVTYELAKLAKEENASLIVIGTHGKGLSFESPLGGTALKIIHSIVKPILVVRLARSEEGACTSECLAIDKPVLYTTDFSDTAELAFTYVEKMVEKGVKRVTLIHVQDKTAIEKHLAHRLDEFNEIDTERLEMLKDRLITLGAQDVKMVLKYGLPIEEILHESKEDDYSLIVMGAQGKGLVKDVFLGSVSGNVVRNTSHPVLLIPALR